MPAADTKSTLLLRHSYLITVDKIKRKFLHFNKINPPQMSVFQIDQYIYTSEKVVSRVERKTNLPSFCFVYEDSIEILAIAS